MTSPFSGRIKYTEKQIDAIRRKAIKAREDSSICDCVGCDDCDGFVVGCDCTVDMEALRRAIRG